MDLMDIRALSRQGMMAQSERMKVAAENLANVDSVERADGMGPYRAKQVYFKSVLNRATGMNEVVASVKEDVKSPLRAEYDPKNELADSRGFVMYPNVDMTVENLNMKEAQRSYEANLSALQIARDMTTKTLDMMR